MEHPDFLKGLMHSSHLLETCGLSLSNSGSGTGRGWQEGDGPPGLALGQDQSPMVTGESIRVRKRRDHICFALDPTHGAQRRARHSEAPKIVTPANCAGTWGRG